jgi:polysaccharide deacetylase 2 family uncharacterized protein YibQ
VNIGIAQLKSMESKTFLIGLGCVAGFYFLLFLYFIVFSNGVRQELEKTLASQIVTIATQKDTQPHAEEHPAGHEENLSTEEDQAEEIESAPIEGLYETSKSGLLLPIIRATDSLTSYNAYKKPFAMPPVGAPPMVAFIVTDFGLSKSTSETAITLLPDEVSYVLSPYADMVDEWAKMIRQSGREVWLDVPFSSQEGSESDRGSLTLYPRSGNAKNQETLHNLFGQAQEYPGIASMRDSKSQNSQDEAYQEIMKEVFERGLAYIDLNPRADFTFSNIAETMNAPYIRADIEITAVQGKNSFEQLEKILMTKGYALATVPNYPENIKRLAAWIIKVAQADYTVVPVSVILDKQRAKMQPSAPTTETSPVIPAHTPAEKTEHPTASAPQNLGQSDKSAHPPTPHEPLHNTTPPDSEHH